MKETKNTVTMKGKPLTLLGAMPKIGEKAPNFKVVSNNLEPIEFSLFKNKICIITSVPSIDTSVCDKMTRRFNEEAAKIGNDVTILTISMDLPFAQKRWCGAADIKSVQTLSDHLEASFGTAYGVLIKELRLLARAVFIVDPEGILRYSQLVKEISSEPDYQEVLNFVKEFKESAAV